MKPLFDSTLGLDWREGISLIMRSAGNDHSKPCYGPAMMKESARIKHRRGFRHSPLAGSQYQEQVFFWLRPPRRASATDRLSASTADSLTARACYIAGLFPAHRLHRVSGLRASDYHALALTRPKLADSCPALCAMRCGIRPKKNRTVARSVVFQSSDWPFISALSGFVSVENLPRTQLRSVSNLPRLAGSVQEKSLHPSSAGGPYNSPRLASKARNAG